MEHPAPIPVAGSPFTVERYFALVDEGVLSEDDRVELLEGVVVAMAPRNAPHDAGICRATEALRAVIGHDVVIRVQSALIIGPRSAPEPDVAVVPGPLSAYDRAHPRTALLVVEVADSSLPQDRITKARMYAGAGIPQYLVLNLRDDVVEVLQDPDRVAGVYRACAVASRGERVGLVPFPGASLAVDELLPGR